MDMTAAGHRQWRAGLRGGEITVAGSAMLLQSAVAACLVFTLMLGAPSPAQAAACEQLFAGGQAPALLNARLAQRTTALCNSAYAALASGVTRGRLWSSVRCVSTIVREPSAPLVVTARSEWYRGSRRCWLSWCWRRSGRRRRFPRPTRSKIRWSPWTMTLGHRHRCV